MNYLALVFHDMWLGTTEVPKKLLASSRGGHCGVVERCSLTQKAEKLGYIPQVMVAANRIFDRMGGYVAQRTVKEMTGAGRPASDEPVTMLGLTLKENCPDTRTGLRLQAGLTLGAL